MDSIQFVRCIKSNEKQTALTADNALILGQLVASGVLQAVAFKQRAFPTKMEYPDFLREYERYLPVPLPSDALTQPRERVDAILNWIACLDWPSYYLRGKKDRECPCAGKAVQNPTRGTNIFAYVRQSLDETKQCSDPNRIYLMGKTRVLMKTRLTVLLDRLKKQTIAHGRARRSPSVLPDNHLRNLMQRGKFAIRRDDMRRGFRYEGTLPDQLQTLIQMENFKYVATLCPHWPYDDLLTMAMSAASQEALDKAIVDRARADVKRKSKYHPLSLDLLLRVVIEDDERMGRVRRDLVDRGIGSLLELKNANTEVPFSPETAEIVEQIKGMYKPDVEGATLLSAFPLQMQ